jgi:hypothetical protein
MGVSLCICFGFESLVHRHWTLLLLNSTRLNSLPYHGNSVDIPLVANITVCQLCRKSGVPQQCGVRAYMTTMTSRTDIIIGNDRVSNKSCTTLYATVALLLPHYLDPYKKHPRILTILPDSQTRPALTSLLHSNPRPPSSSHNIHASS